MPADQWEQAPPKELAEYIERKPHAFCPCAHRSLRSLSQGGEPPWRRSSRDIPGQQSVCRYQRELIHHFYCEENILFQHISQSGTEQQAGLPPVFGGVQQPIARMMAKADQAGAEPRLLRELTNNYTLPAAACLTWRALEQVAKAACLQSPNIEAMSGHEAHCVGAAQLAAGDLRTASSSRCGTPLAGIMNRFGQNELYRESVGSDLHILT